MNPAFTIIQTQHRRIQHVEYWSNGVMGYVLSYDDLVCCKVNSSCYQRAGMMVLRQFVPL